MHEEEIATFVALTGADRSSATQYLESCGWNVEEAFNLYSVGDGGDNLISPADNFDTVPIDHFESDAAMAAAFSDSPKKTQPRRHHRSSKKSSEQKFGDAYDDDGVRAPTEYTTGRLVDDNPFADFFNGAPMMMPMGGGGGMHGFPLMMSGRGGDGGHLNPPKVVDLPDSDWMFPLPKEAKKLNCGGEIAYARQRAKEEKKWLLVSLQSIDIFDSHRMNRDVWSNESILSVIESSFILWQRASTSLQGANFLRLYGISDEALPITIIIGPTGTLLFSRTGFMPVDEMSSSLFEFVDSHDMDSTEAPQAPRQHRSSTSEKPVTPTFEVPPDLDEEDDALTAAIAMSLNSDQPTASSSPSTTKAVSSSDPLVDSTKKLSLGDNKLNDDFDSYVAPSAHEVLSDEAPSDRMQDDVGSNNVGSSHLPATLPLVGDEPVKGTPCTTRMQLRLADGKTVVRRFFLDDTIASIYALVLEKIPEGRTKPFVLQTPIATAFKLLDVAEETIAAQNLANSKILMSWDD